MEFLILLSIILSVTVIFKNNKVKELNNEKIEQEEKNKQLVAKIKQADVEIKNVKLENESLNKRIDSNHNTIDNLKSKIDELVKELSFYTEIKNDSLNLNVEDESTIDIEKSIPLGESESIDVTDLNEEKAEIII
jgi:predicted nuclease with TOPRIM domain